MADRKDPFHGCCFRIEWDGIQQVGFREVSGISFDQPPTEYRNGDEQMYVRKIPGLNKFGDLVCKRGVTANDEVWEWRKKCIAGNVERKNGSVLLCDDTGNEKVRWNFREGWPTKMTISGFNATSNDVAIEELTIALEWIEKT